MAVLKAALMCALICPLTAGCGRFNSGSSSSGPPIAAAGQSPNNSPAADVPSVKEVLEWIVGFAGSVGEFISRTAGSLAEALAAAWDTFWGPKLVNNVRVDSDDPLRGIYEGVLACRVDWGQAQQGKEEQKNHVSISLDHPKMVRKSEATTKWELADEETQRIQSAVDNYLLP